MSPLDILRDIFYLPIFNVLMFLYWVVRDFGLSIVLLTIIVRLALVPMTFKQLHSQRKMMEIQPHIAALKAEYGDDKQGFAKAQMQLMKDNNVSMLGGCLPLVIQLPFLYGLFYALSAGLKSNPGETVAQHVVRINQDLYPFMQFAHVTIPGGSHPLNTMLTWLSWLPWHPALNLAIADPTHILPVVAALLTFIQVRMIQGVRKQPQLSANADPKAVAQQNAQMQTMSLMTYITPVITLVIGLQYAAGLSLYWIVGTTFAVGQSYFIYGWGNLFKGIPRLEEWAARKNAAREERREARYVAKGIIAAPVVVESSLALASPNGTSRNGAKRKDWIDQAKGQTTQAAKAKERPNTARPFATLMKSKEDTTTAGAPKGEATTSNGSTNGAKPEAKNGSGATNGAMPEARMAVGPSMAAKVTTTKGTTSTSRAGGTPSQRRVPPGGASLPKPKGGKK